MQNLSDEIQAKRKRAKGKLTLRILVALYLLYLTKGIVEAAVQRTSTLPLWVTWLVSIVSFWPPWCSELTRGGNTNIHLLIRQVNGKLDVPKKRIKIIPAIWT